MEHTLCVPLTDQKLYCYSGSLANSLPKVNPGHCTVAEPTAVQAAEDASVYLVQRLVWCSGHVCRGVRVLLLCAVVG